MRVRRHLVAVVAASIVAVYLGSYLAARGAHVLVDETWWGAGFPPARVHRIGGGRLLGSGVALLAYAPLVFLEERARNGLSQTAFMIRRDNASHAVRSGGGC